MINHLYDIIKPTLKKLNNPEVVWFRGHSDSHRLLPSLMKFTNGLKNELFIYTEFRNAYSITDSCSNIDWNTLIKMHHNYTPTRLLAWTSNIYVALFCSIIRENCRPSIFILDPIRLNRKSKINNILNLDTELKIRYHDLISKKSIHSSFFPFCIQSTIIQENVLVDDNNKFTVHNNSLEPIEKQCNDCVIKIVLNEKQVELSKKIISSLKWLNH